MNMLQESLREAARHGESLYSYSGLAQSRARVKSRARVYRSVTTVASVAAGTGLVAGAGWGAGELGVFDGQLSALSPATQVTDTAGISSQAASATPSASATVESMMVTLPAGVTAAEAAHVLSETYGIGEGTALAAIENQVAALAPQASTAEGWFAPASFDTGAFPTVDDAAAYLVSLRVGELNALGIEPAKQQDIVTTASLIYREAKLTTDYALVSSVITNRLEAGLRLELDSTVRYISPEESFFVTAEELAIDSPYNTFMYQGLPPGAIGAPDLLALQAALTPADTDYLFFVTVDLTSGETAFASTFEEHAANVQRLNDWIAANQN